MTRGLFALSCRAFPPEHRARYSDEVVDTAALAAGGSAWSAAREASSLVVAGLRERLRAESRHSAREGFTLLAWALALVNLAVALAGISFFVVDAPWWAYGPLPFSIGVVDWWWIAFALAATGIVVGLALGQRWLAIGGALVNVAVVGYDAVFLADNSMNDLRLGHLDVFTAFRRVLSFPAERQWFAVAGVLALATFAAPMRRLPLRRIALVPVIVCSLVLLSRGAPDGFAFLIWPFAALVLLGVLFGAVAPRLAVVAIGVTLAAVPSVDTYLTTPLPPPPGTRGYFVPAHHGALTMWAVSIGLVLGVLLPLAQLARRHLA